MTKFTLPILTHQEGVAVEIAEAVLGALKGELSATAVNAPMVAPEVNIVTFYLTSTSFFFHHIICHIY